MDQPFFFQHGDKLIRINHAEIRIDPAGKRLKTAELPGGGADHRLIERLDLMVIDRLLKILYDKLLEISSHGIFSRLSSDRGTLKKQNMLCHVPIHSSHGSTSSFFLCQSMNRSAAENRLMRSCLL